MADRLMRAAVALFALALLSSAVQAQTPMADPTRPPAALFEAAAPAGADSGPVLQSVLIPKKGKPLVVIGGQQVRLGQRYGESRLIKVSEREAVLEGPEGIERLLLTPGVEKAHIDTVTNRTRKLPAQRPAQGEGKP